MGGPLSGVKILEIAGIGPGPFSAMMLADMGAEVLRIDRADRVPAEFPDTPDFDCLNRGRRNIGVNLKHAEGVETVLELVSSVSAPHKVGVGVAERGHDALASAVDVTCVGTLGCLVGRADPGDRPAGVDLDRSSLEEAQLRHV